jgi:hypothetical protein
LLGYAVIGALHVISFALLGFAVIFFISSFSHHHIITSPHHHINTSSSFISPNSSTQISRTKARNAMFDRVGWIAK